MVRSRLLATTTLLSVLIAATVGAHPAFIRMIRDLVQERVHGAPRLALGTFPASHDVCAVDCCLLGAAR